MPFVEAILQQQRRGGGIDVEPFAAAIAFRGARGEALVAVFERQAEIAGEALGLFAGADGLRTFLAAQRQRQTDEQHVYSLVTDNATQHVEVALTRAAVQRRQRPRHAGLVVTDGEADTPLAEIERKISHDPAGERTSIRNGSTGNRGHHDGEALSSTNFMPRAFNSEAAAARS